MKRHLPSTRIFAFIVTTVFIAACGGGGGGGGGNGGGLPMVTPCPSGYTGTAPSCVLATSGSTSSVVSTSSPTSIALAPVGGYGGTLGLSTASAASTITVADQTPAAGAPPGGNPVLQGSLRRAARAWGTATTQSGSSNTPLLYVTVTASTLVSFPSSPSMTVTLPAASSGPFYVAQFVGGAWETVAGPGTVTGTSVSFAASSGSFNLSAGVATYFAFYTGGVIATPTPAPPSVSACTTTSTNPQSVAREAMMMGGRLGDGTPRRAQQSGYRGNDYAPGLLEVSYDRARLGSITNVRRGEIDAGADTLTSQLSFPHIGRIVRVLRVSGDVPTVLRNLQALPGVVSVSRVGLRRPTATAAELPNDPYLVNEHSAGGTTGTLIGPPFYQNAGTGGQWDMHLLCVSHAWGYSQSSGNSFGVLPGAVAGSVKIAIVDTGVDITHPDLAGKVVHSAMFESRNGTLTPGTMTDQNGHGTDVAGIAAADTNNDFGFAGTGYNAQIIAERVFGPPDAQGCPDSDSSPTCYAYTPDIAAAINDAVSNGANVINLSLGGSCPDTADEQGAIDDAIAAGVVVVAAAGNESSSTLDAPACDPGVIAAGASALNDGEPNGSGYSGTNPEYVAAYSDYDSTNPTAWGVVAPGGDPLPSPSDNDLLHWIMNIYTSTSADPAFGPTQVCTVDPFGESGNCRIEIAGTSMASPHVAGVAALMLGAHPGLTPAVVKSILCQSALNINDPHQGCGRVDAYRAVARAVGDGSVP